MSALHKVRQAARVYTVLDAASPEAVIAQLEQATGPAAAPWTIRDEEGKTQKNVCLLHLPGKPVEEVDITEVPAQSANAAQTEKLLSMMPPELPIDQFELVLQNRGDEFTLPWNEGKLLVVALSYMDPSYFDLAVSDTKTFRLCYNQVTPIGRLGCMRHSGDERRPNNGLCHFVRMEAVPATVTDFVLYVSGYSGYSLDKYKSVMLMIPDHQSRILRVIPAPLDTATVGTHRGMMLVGLRWLPKERHMVVKVMDNPVMFDLEVACDIKLISSQFAAVVAATPNTVTAAAPVPQPAKETAKASKVVGTPSKAGVVSSDVASGTVPVVFDADCDDRLLTTFLKQGDEVFVCGTSVVATVWRDELELDLACHGELNLPALRTELATGPRLPHLPVTGGTLEGPFCALLVRTAPKPKTGFAAYCRSAGRTGRPALVVASSEMEEGVAVLQRARVNGLCIIDATRANIPGPAAVHNMLQNLSQVAAVSRMGPVSSTIAALRVEGQISYYFMGGLSFPGLFGDKACTFGQSVTDVVTANAADWLHGLRPDVFSPAFSSDVEFQPGSSVAFFQDRWVTGEEVLALFRANTARLLESFQPVELLLPQLRRALPAQELGKLVDEIMAVVTEIATAEQEKQRGAFAAMLEEGMPLEEVLQKRSENKFKKSINAFLRMIKATTSEVGAYTQNYSLAQQQRKAKIAGNVAAATNMTQDDLQSFLTETCPTSVALAVDNGRLQDCYAAVIGEQFSNQLGQLGLADALLQLDSTYYDPDTLGSLLEIASSNNHPLAHIGPGQVLAVQNWRKPSTSVIFLPLLAERLDFPLSGADVANDPDIAKLRILLRNTLVNNQALQGREVAPQAKDIGWFLVYIILNALLAVTSRFSNVPQPNVDSDNTACQVVRGLMWLLATTLASGANPMSMAYQIFIPRTVRPDLPRTPAENAIYWVIARTFRYMAPSSADQRFNLTQITQNLSRWLVRLVIRKFMDPFLNSLRVQAKAEKVAGRTAAWYHDRLSLLNSKYYPVYHELMELAESVSQSKSLSEEQQKTNQRLKGVFVAEPELRNRRYKVGNIFKLFRFLQQVHDGKIGESTFQNIQILADKIRRKWEPRHWAVPLPGAKPTDDAMPFPGGLEPEEQQAKAVVAAVPDTPLSQLTELAITAAPGQAKELADARDRLNTLFIDEAPTPAKFKEICAPLNELPNPDWFITLAQSAEWGQSEADVAQTLRTIVSVVCENASKDNGEIEKAAFARLNLAFMDD